MKKNQKFEILKMKKELGLIEMYEYRPTEDEEDTNNEIIECDGIQYEIIDELDEKEKAECISIQNAYNLLAIRRGVKFFVTLGVLGIIAGVILGIISIL